MTKVATYTCPYCKKPHPKVISKCPTENATVPETYRLVGDTIDGKYKLEARIGEGGMGAVYRGTHTAIGRKIAVKVLHADIQSHEEVVFRFQNEARLAASIGHRNIVDIIDMGKYLGKYHFIVMEFLEGEDLFSVIRRRETLRRDEAIDLAIQVLNGLKAVHKKGIIHRDLKPENIFVCSGMDEEKTVKILDFGVSRLMDKEKRENVRITRAGMVFGTPRYMSPEQAKGSEKHDHRADLYAVGAMLYEMLCGFPPFSTENYNELMVEILTKKPALISEIEPAISPALERVVMKSIEKNPEDRYQDAAGFIEAIAPFSSSPLYRSSLSGEIVFSPELLAQTVLGDLADPESSVEVKVRDFEFLRRLRTVAAEAEKRPDPTAQTPKYGSILSGRKQAGDIHRQKTLDPGEAATPPAALLEAAEMDRSRTPAPAGDDGVEQATPGAFESIVATRGKKKLLYVAIPLVLVVAALISLAVYLAPGKRGAADQEKGMALEPAADTVSAGPGAAGKTGGKEEKSGGFSEILIENLPGNAKVYIDNVLHTERPPVIQSSTKPRAIKVVMDSEIVMEEHIIVQDGMSIPFTHKKQQPEKAPGTMPEPAVNKTPGPVKEKAPNKVKKKKSSSKSKLIDEVYPGS
ncbi:MAG: serine/threonine-protein kinase [Pseudomonadota bacterium]